MAKLMEFTHPFPKEGYFFSEVAWFGPIFEFGQKSSRQSHIKMLALTLKLYKKYVRNHENAKRNMLIPSDQILLIIQQKTVPLLSFITQSIIFTQQFTFLKFQLKFRISKKSPLYDILTNISQASSLLNPQRSRKPVKKFMPWVQPMPQKFIVMFQRTFVRCPRLSCLIKGKVLLTSKDISQKRFLVCQLLVVGCSLKGCISACFIW